MWLTESPVVTSGLLGAAGTFDQKLTVSTAEQRMKP